MPVVMRGFEQIPWLYDLSMRCLPGLERWRRTLVDDATAPILEVGCGTGQTLPWYPHGARIVAFDPNREALRRARSRRPDAALFCGSVERLPFADECFATVVSALVLCSVPEPARGLAEIRRVLRPGGRLLMLEHVHARHAVGRRLLDAAQPPWTWLTGGCHPNRDTEALVEAAGFEISPAGYRARGLLRLFAADKC